MWPIWFRSEISSGKDFEILWNFIIFQIFISTVLSDLHTTDVIPHCTDVIPHCTEGIPHCTEYPLQYWCYPPLYWCCPPHVLMISPNVLNTLHSTEAIPHCTDVIPHCTEQPPQYWRYPPHVLLLSPHSTEGILPQYWIPSTVLMLSPTVLMLSSRMYWCHPPTVLNNLHSTEAILPQYWCYPPMYWTTSNVLNNLHSTEPTLYGVVPRGGSEEPGLGWLGSVGELPALHFLLPRVTSMNPSLWLADNTVDCKK